MECTWKKAYTAVCVSERETGEDLRGCLQCVICSGVQAEGENLQAYRVSKVSTMHVHTLLPACKRQY